MDCNLSDQANNSGESYKPYVAPSDNQAEFTFKAIFLGAIFGVLFGAANAYLGLMAGLTVSTSIPVAVMTVGFFRLTQGFFGKTTILEHNMAQTTGSASSSLASGIIFTIPALFLWGMNPSIFQMAGLAMVGGLMGVLFMIPLRRYLIRKEHGKLPYPEGTACAQVLIAADAGGARAGNVFLGLGIGAAYKFLAKGLGLWKEKIFYEIPGIKNAQLGLHATPAMLAVGYILGYRVAAIMVSGSLISWVVLIPLMTLVGEHLTVPIYPEATQIISEMTPSQIWTRYIRYIGAGAVAFGGIVTIIRSIPTMMASFKIAIAAMKKRVAPGETDNTVRTDRDLSLKWVLYGTGLIVSVLVLVPFILGENATMGMRLLAAPAIAIFGFFFVTVSSRIVGLVGVSSNPTSGMTIVTLLGVAGLFVLMGWTDDVGRATVLVVGTVVCVAASIAGDTSQDLKTGFLIGATPSKQQIGELIGAASSAFAVAASIVLLNNAYGFGTADLPAPQATLVKTIIDGVLSGNIPWALVLIGVMLGAVVELCSLPSLPFAVGLYLPLSTMTPIFVGGCIRHFLEHRHRNNEEQLKRRREKGILFASGLIGGEGLLMVGVAAYAYYKGKPEGIGEIMGEPFSSLLSLALFLGLGYYLYKRTRD